MELPSEPLMDALFASQSASESQKILVHSDGRGYNIHLQVNGILQRPSLVRMLRKAGAHPSRPEDADIILVDSSQPDGKRLIRTWNHTPGKAVLEFQWLRRSIEAKKPLLEDDGWAGAQTVDDGEAILIDEIAADGEEAEVEQIVSKSPLPTPRVTPDESFTSRKTNNIPAIVTADLPFLPNDPMPHKPQWQSPPVDTPQQQSQEHGADAVGISSLHQTSNTPQPIPLPHQVIPALPYNNSQTPPQTQSAQPATSAPFTHPQFSQAPQFSQSQFSQLAQFPQQFPVAQQSYQFSQLPTQQPPPGQMSFMPQPMMMSTGLPFSNLGDPQSFSMFMTFMDVLRNKNGGEFLQAGQPSPMHAQIEAASSAPPPIRHEQTPDSTYPPSSSSYKSRTRTPETATSQHPKKKPRPTRKPRFDKYSRSRSRELLPPSVKRRIKHEVIQPSLKTPENPPTKRSSKGKERAVTPDDFASDEDIPAGSDDILEAPASEPTRKGAVVAKTYSGEVFLNDQGRPLSFFVQVDLQGRAGVVSNIKKHKGKITGSIADADYVILFTRSQTFQGLFSEAQACDKVPIQSTFVTDCIAENALLDENDYALDTTTFPKQAKRGRPSGLFEFALVETPVSTKTEKKPKKLDARKATSVETPVKKVTKKSAPTSSKKSAAVLSSHNAKSPSARRSPTPPPPETRKATRDGKFYFTQPEYEYFLQYSQFLLDEDPMMSTSALLQAMHKKMPHHSLASWQAKVSSKLNPQLIEIRKRANVTYRKSMPGSVEKPTEEGKPGPSKKPRLAASATARTQSQEALEREDFEVICQYFANGGGDDDDDERVWAKLSQHRPCKSAESWPEYYTAHQTEVYARIEELVRLPARWTNHDL